MTSRRCQWVMKLESMKRVKACPEVSASASPSHALLPVILLFSCLMRLPAIWMRSQDSLWIDLEDGSIVEQGSHQQLLARGGRYAALIRNQAVAQKEYTNKHEITYAKRHGRERRIQSYVNT